MKSLQVNEGDIFLKRGKTAIFLLHGFFSTPEEISSVANILADNGFTVYCPCLPIYSSYEEASLINFCKADYREWKKEAETAFLNLKKEFDKVYVGGHSCGSNLAIILASKHKVEGIISLGTAIYLSMLLRFTRRIIRFVVRIIVRKNAAPFFQATSALSIFDMANIIKETKKILPKIEQPIIIIHSKDDKMILPQSAKYIYRKVGFYQK